RIAIVAGRAVRLVRVGAGPVRGIANAGLLALGRASAGDVGAKVLARADAGGADVVHGCGIAVVADGAVGLVRIGAAAVGGVANAGLLALGLGVADDVRAEIHLLR